MLFLMASPILAQDDALLSRIRPIVGKDTSCAVVYSSYRSGRPQLVVAGTDQGVIDKPGEVVLIHFQDAKDGRGNVVHRLRAESGVVDLAPVHLVDSKDIAATLSRKHSSQGITLRVSRQKLVRIADALPNRLVDLDGDGIPEIIAGLDGNAGQCGWRGHPVLLRWRAKDYEEDDRDYVAVASAKSGGRPESSKFETPLVPGGRHHYVVHFYRGRGASNAEVLVDGVAVETETPLDLSDGCHALAFEVFGAVGAEGWAFVEERP